MLNDELEIPTNYFHESTPEHLQMLGVDPAKPPDRKKWLEYFQTDVQKPNEQRGNILLLWLDDEKPNGYPYRETRDDDTWKLVDAIKSVVDPERLINSGSLGLK